MSFDNPIFIIAIVYTILSWVFFPSFVLRLYKKLKNKIKEATQFNDGKTPSTMTDAQYIVYLENELKTLQFMHNNAMEVMCTQYPGVDKDSYVRVIESIFRKTSELLTQYDNKRISAEGTLDTLREYMKFALAPVVKTAIYMRNTPEGKKFEQIMENIRDERSHHHGPLRNN